MSFVRAPRSVFFFFFADSADVTRARTTKRPCPLLIQQIPFVPYLIQRISPSLGESRNLVRMCVRVYTIIIDLGGEYSRD